MIKIIGGTYRSRSIEIPNEGTVPTKSMVREAVFSALSDKIPGANVLDLFAGSGALGIEALSRGAASAYFVDRGNEAYRTILANLATLKETHGHVLKADYANALTSLAAQKLVFDVVFLDPPYADKAYYQDAVNQMMELNLLAPKAAIMLEYEGDLPFAESAFPFARHYNYGRTHVLIVRRAL
ncbi:MAG: Ribosomal RNA small subunit methyltransferase D [Tenericutes bacterium ADurb.BinA155]|jgi:16S rRNA (guanine966-N2)-methyltransferase|nr:MAG: Ribosomal RNA small subunit methyltransferase D [Tenericutes bacterium ADurb.BinA155]